MKLLFKQFSRIRVEGQPVAEGSGLGLYLSKKIADLLGGQIKAQSEFGKGSKFTFTLPLEYMEAKT
jgi:signal transduction histidine kinase